MKTFESFVEIYRTIGGEFIYSLLICESEYGHVCENYIFKDNSPYREWNGSKVIELLNFEESGVTLDIFNIDLDYIKQNPDLWSYIIDLKKNEGQELEPYCMTEIRDRFESWKDEATKFPY